MLPDMICIGIILFFVYAMFVCNSDQSCKRNYTEQERKTYWEARCYHCGWQGLTVGCFGFGSIADTGDYEEGICPDCLCEIDEDESSQPLSLHLLWMYRRLSFWKIRLTAKRERHEQRWHDKLIEEYGDF